MRILLLTRYERLGSSSRVRFYQYLPYLTAHGMEIVTAPFFTDEYVRNLYAGQRPSLKTVLGAYLKRLSILLSSNSFDALWVEKELFPWLPAGIGVPPCATHACSLVGAPKPSRSTSRATVAQ